MAHELELYKIARASVEHFDKILATLRQIIVAFNGIFVGAAISVLFGEGALVIRYQRVFLFNFILAITSIVFWLVEKHYHRYLITSTLLAKRLEAKLFKDDSYHLTSELRNANVIRYKYFFFLKRLPFIKKLLTIIPTYIRTYDLLYIIPIVVSLVLNILLPSLALQDANNKPWMWWCGSLLTIFYLLVCCEIIKYNRSFLNNNKNET